MTVSVSVKTLKEGEIMVRKRLNRRIKKCGGCSNSIAEDPLTPPHDLIFCKKEKRPKKNCRWSSTKEEDFVITNVHYHIDIKCIKKIHENILLEDGVSITPIHIEYFHNNGIYYFRKPT